MKSKSGLTLTLAVLAAVIAGLVLPGFLLKLDKTPSFDLEGYQTVEISTASSTDYAWRLRVISKFYITGGGGFMTYSDVTEQYTQEQRENIQQQFIAQLGELEALGVLSSGTGEKISSSSRADSWIIYLFDAAELRGTQCAMVYVTDPEEPGLQLLSGIVDLESGKILGLSGYTSAWSELMERAEADENTYQEVLAGYADYLGMVEPTEEVAEYPRVSEDSDSSHYREVALPSDRSSAMYLWLELMPESFLLRLQS